jgi:putative toxin-antitoxin system antitoxin component (TIGR02293 family)
MDVRRGRSRSQQPSPSKKFRSAWDSLGVSTESGIGAVKRGLPIRHLEQFLKHAQLPRSAVFRVLKLTASEYQKRISSRRLTPLESERLWRLAKVYKKSLDLFEGNAEQAASWLKSPQRALQGVSPLLSTVTEPGASEVEELIGRIEYGVLS